MKLSGKERNPETGLDYFGAKYMSAAQGRFTGPDPEIIPSDLTNPQAWNKYAYGLNNPLRFIDPDGAAAIDAGLVLGTASFNVYRQQSSIDVAAMLVTGWPTQPSRLVQPENRGSRSGIQLK